MKFSHTSKAVNCRETKGLLCIANITVNHGVSDLGGGIWVRKAIKSVFRGLCHGCEFRKPSKRSQAIFRTKTTHNITGGPKVGMQCVVYSVLYTV